MDVEKVLIGGDLAQLTPDQRLNYYNTLCVSLGLNSLTQPFQYIVLNGKLQLYAKKDCTEQLRKIHGVSISKIDPKTVGDLVVVVADAADRDGRVDSSTGAVAVKGLEKKDRNGNYFTYDLKGEDLANAMMKAETKAKRRVTLSICGLGMLDETEVQTLREQGVATEPAGNKWEAPNPTPAVAGAASTTQAVQEGTSSVSAISHDDSEPVITPRSRRGAQPSTQPPSTQPAASQEPAIKAGEVFPKQATGPDGQLADAEGVFPGEPLISNGTKNHPAPYSGGDKSPRAKRYFMVMKAAGVSDEQSAQQLASLGYYGSRDSMPVRIYDEAIRLLDPENKLATRQ
jgi:hypothetical protein